MQFQTKLFVYKTKKLVLDKKYVIYLGENQMTHKMKLNQNAFINIKNGKKIFELRLYDEKRKNINLGDIITFHNLNNFDETISVKVLALLRYPSFEDFFKDIDYKLCGTANSLQEKLEHVHTFYAEEQEKKYGILAIKLKLIN